MTVLQTSWPEASIAMVGSGGRVRGGDRGGLAGVRDVAGADVRRARGAYRRLAEEAGRAQRETADRLDRIAAELAELRTVTTEADRAIKEVG